MLSAYINIYMSKTGLLLAIINNIRAADTQDGKLAILTKYANEVQLRRILNIVYNPWIDLKLQKFETKHMGKRFGMGMSQFLHIFSDIISGNFDQREAEFSCRMALMHVNSDEAELFLGIARQDLNLNLDIDTINKAWPGLIVEYPIRLAQPGDITGFTSFPAAVQPLSQGLRVNAVVHEGSATFRDKTGAIIEGWDIYHQQFINLAQGQNTVFDGHAIVANGDKIVETDNDMVRLANPEDIRFVIWDAVRYDGFVQGADTRIGYNWRYNGIEHMMMLAMEKNPKPCYTVTRAELVGSAEQLAETVRLHQQCVIKSLAGTWSQGPTTEEIIYTGKK
jgi:hypothetical protein